MKCKFLIEDGPLICNASQLTYIPTDFQYEEYCRKKDHRKCPFYLDRKLRTEDMTETVTCNKKPGEKRVLVVDDEAAFLMAISRILDGPGLHVDTAENFDDAMALINGRRFNFVITDIRLTDVINTEGLDILRHVKATQP